MSQQTGPRTAEGKARSASNATTHGFTAQRIIVPDDRREEFAEFQTALREEIAPTGALESVAFHQLLHAAWNLLRLAEMESEIFAYADDPFGDQITAKKLARLSRYQVKHQRAYSQAFKQIQQLQTNGFIRPTLPDELEADIPVLADVQQVHFAKRNQREAWPTPMEAMMDQVERDAQAAQRDSRAMDDLNKMAS